MTTGPKTDGSEERHTTTVPGVARQDSAATEDPGQALDRHPKGNPGESSEMSRKRFLGISESFLKISTDFLAIPEDVLKIS